MGYTARGPGSSCPRHDSAPKGEERLMSTREQITFDQELDVRGLSCPMPIVRARQAVGKLDAGQVLRVLSTDRGSVRDFQGWAKASKAIELAAQDTEQHPDGEVFVHYIRKIQ